VTVLTDHQCKTLDYAEQMLRELEQMAKRDGLPVLAVQIAVAAGFASEIRSGKEAPDFVQGRKAAIGN
jgi:hypothetical protein